MPDDQPDVAPLTAAEAAALRSLRRDATPPAGLADRVVGAMRSLPAAIVPPRRPAWEGWLVLVAAAVAAFFFGRISATGTRAVIAPGAPYAFLLLDGAGYQEASGPEATERVEGYRDWAARLRDEGRYQAGEELLPAAGRVIAPDGSPGSLPVPPMVGMFIIRAADFETALDIARTLPHLDHGGEVAVVPIAEH